MNTTFKSPAMQGEEARLIPGQRVELYEMQALNYFERNYKQGRVYPAHLDLAGMVWLLSDTTGTCVPFIKEAEVKAVGAITIKTVK